MRRCSVALAALLCCAAFAGACSRQRPAEQAAEDELAVPVAAQPAQTGSIRTVVRASGVVTPAEGAEFLATAPEPARVVEITKEEGAPVASGEALVRFELPLAAQDLTRVRADLAGAQAQLENARVAQTRTRDFVTRGLIPRVELDAADRTLADAQAAVENAQAAVAAAEQAASRSVVRAPFDGVVAQRLHQPGDLVQGTVADPVLRVVDPRRLEVTAMIPPADISRVLPGASARMTSPVDARVIRLAVTARPSAAQPRADGSLPVRLEFADPHDVTVNTQVDVEIDAEERTGVVFVSPEAVLQDKDETVLFVVNGDRAERRLVTTGLADDQRVEITSGLRPNELVITQGHFGLTDGTKISAVVR
jgi:cobalt-zinc-cadmium efflux system membrane fusion protein